MTKDQTASTYTDLEDTSETASEGRGAVGTVVSTAQSAAGKVADVAGTAAERLPAAMATAQSVAGETQRTLDTLPNQALILGTSFSLGLAVGMFVTGTNRLLVLLALAPAAAMAATLVGRDTSMDEVLGTE